MTTPTWPSYRTWTIDRNRLTEALIFKRLYSSSGSKTAAHCSSGGKVRLLGSTLAEDWDTFGALVKWFPTILTPCAPDRPITWTEGHQWHCYKESTNWIFQPFIHYFYNFFSILLSSFFSYYFFTYYFYFESYFSYLFQTFILYFLKEHFYQRWKVILTPMKRESRLYFLRLQSISRAS